MTKVFDIAIIGGGINGCGIAADAALRGLSVALIEKDDFASKTSSNSSKLIHGGLRYLEHYEFRLVKKALKERQKLLEIAPHLVRPLAFVLPHHKAMRPSWLLRSGLFIYDRLISANKLPKSKGIIRTKQTDYFYALLPEYNRGFLFYDCTTDDARLTLANAIQAKEHGGIIYNQTELIEALPKDQGWQLHLKNKKNQTNIIHAKVLINAAGPWVNELNQRLNTPIHQSMTLVKGSHVLVNKLYNGNHAYLLQHNDDRIVFIIPYHGYTLIGTTDVPFDGNLDTVDIEQQEIDYLLGTTNQYFNLTLSSTNIIFSYSGVRALLTENGQRPQALSRDYRYHLSQKPALILSIYGGKITTYRQLASEAIDTLIPYFKGLGRTQTHQSPLPGSDCPQHLSFSEYCLQAKQTYSWLDNHLLNRYLQTYGTRTSRLLENCSKMEDLGVHVAHGLFQREIEYLVAEEWVVYVEDLLWRRTKLGLLFNEEEKRQLADYLKDCQTKTIIPNSARDLPLSERELPLSLGMT